MTSKTILITALAASFLQEATLAHPKANSTAILDTGITNCLDCILESSDQYWCVSTKKCYSSTLTIAGADCTKPAIWE